MILHQPRRNARIRGNRQSKRSVIRTGAALVEFALVAPLMILFTLGLIDIGRMTMVKQLLVNASREGARRATLPNATSFGVESEVQQMLTNSGVTGTVSLSPALLTASAPGSTVTVTVSANANSVSWLGTSMFMAGKMLTASTSMRRESL
ncbi:MAG: TadE/TadG family type IV pilus assembly protein [Pirellula sp.]